MQERAREIERQEEEAAKRGGPTLRVSFAKTLLEQYVSNHVTLNCFVCFSFSGKQIKGLSNNIQPSLTII